VRVKYFSDIALNLKHKTMDSVIKRSFDEIGNKFNPVKEENYFCDNCNDYIKESRVEWKNDTPICPVCENEIKL